MLADAFWPGPLTILLNKKSHIPDILTSGLSDVAVRIPRHPLYPFTAFTAGFPTSGTQRQSFWVHLAHFGTACSGSAGCSYPVYTRWGSSCSVGIESTIIGFNEQEQPIVYRLGGRKIDDIEQVVGKVKLRINHSSDPIAPGMLKSHYAPSKRLIIGNLTELVPRFHKRNFGVISFHQSFDGLTADRQIILSKTRNLDEAARQLFGALRTMDQKDVEFIITEKFPDMGLGQAINDRLKRAATR